MNEIFNEIEVVILSSQPESNILKSQWITRGVVAGFVVKYQGNVTWQLAQFCLNCPIYLTF